MAAPPVRSDSYFSGHCPRWKRAIARTVAAGNRTLHALPPCRAFYRWQLRRSLEWTELELRVGPDRAGLDGLTGVFLSDIHVGSYLVEPDLHWLVDRVAEREPDVVLFGGDMVHTQRHEYDAWRRPLQRLRPPLGTFAVPGNHERFGSLDIELWFEQMDELGIEPLRNRGVRLGDDAGGLWLAGVDDLTEGAPDLDFALEGRAVGEPTIVLSHHPDLWPEIRARGVDLTLSGHTHGGQILPFGWTPVKHSDLGFDRGTAVSGNQRLHVGRGLGAVIVPLRWGSRPEIVRFRVAVESPAETTGVRHPHT